MKAFLANIARPQNQASTLAMKVGLSFATGLITIVLAAALWWTWGAGLAQKGKLLQDQVAALEKQSRSEAEPKAVKTDPQLGAKADDLWARLPTKAEVPDLVVEVSRLAALVKLDVQTLNVTYVGPTKQRPERVEIALQVKGSYPSIRAFVTMVSNSIPAASVNRLQVTRSDETGKSLDTLISLFIWTRAP